MKEFPSKAHIALMSDYVLWRIKSWQKMPKTASNVLLVIFLLKFIRLVLPSWSMSDKCFNVMN